MMTRFWRQARPEAPKPYNVRSLIDTEFLVEESDGSVQIVCDIDKTYIETRFESAVSMIKIAFEDADAKVTVHGASLALMAARWGGSLDQDRRRHPRSLHFLSASPPQLRKVIREKLAKDGLDWTSDTFKNQAYNIKMGRLKLLKQHVAYKAATLLDLANRAPDRAKFYLIGDNAELDAYIYCGVSMLLSKELSPAAFKEYLRLGKVDDEVLTTLDPLIQRDFRGVEVGGILIRKAPGYVFLPAEPLTQRVLSFDSFFEVILHFASWGLCPYSILPQVVRQLHNGHGLSREELFACLLRLPDQLPEEAKPWVQKADELLRQGPAHALLPDRQSFRLHSADFSSLQPESLILSTAEKWLHAIESRH